MKVLFLPDYPDREFYTIIPVFMRLGWFATQDPQAEYSFAMCWQDATWMQADARLTEASQSRPVLNQHCLDISKRRVEQDFVAETGRATLVDPLTYSGQAVCKYDENARGGHLVQLPLQQPDPRFVYQRLIDASTAGHVVEYRVPVILNHIPVVYRELKEIPRDKIKTRKHSVQLREPEDEFSGDEIRQILAFCGRMGLDFGELDILRCNEDGQLYILDANKTPGGFGIFNKVNWRHEQRQEAIERLATAFESGIAARLDVSRH